MEVTIYTDGASRGNPGHASYGYLILDENNQIIHQEGKYLGIATNNFAEYSAVLSAFSYIHQNLYKGKNMKIAVIADSKLVVEQLSGKYKIKSENLKPLIYQIKILEQTLGQIKYTHTLRANNKRADALANKALDDTFH